MHFKVRLLAHLKVHKWLMFNTLYNSVLTIYCSIIGKPISGQDIVARSDTDIETRTRLSHFLRTCVIEDFVYVPHSIL